MCPEICQSALPERLRTCNSLFSHSFVCFDVDFAQHGLFCMMIVCVSVSLPAYLSPIVRVSFSLSWTPRDGFPFVLLFFIYLCSFLLVFGFSGFLPTIFRRIPCFLFLIPRFPDVHWTLAVPLASFYTKCFLSLSSDCLFISIFLYYSALSPSLINEEPRLSTSFVVKIANKAWALLGLSWVNFFVCYRDLEPKTCASRTRSNSLVQR